MGYTELNICFDLKKDTPKSVIDILHYLIVTEDNKPLELPKHPFFECRNWGIVACCYSYYFDGLTNSKMMFDNITEQYKVNIRSNLKNYDDVIDYFLDWLAPYMSSHVFIGYSRFEEFEDPSLIYIGENNEVIIKTI